MTTLLSPPAATAVEPTSPGRPGRLHRLWRGRPSDPAWARPSLLALLAGAALLYLWGLDRSGYGNTFYAAAVQAGTKSWKAFFFGSSDAASSITVDKPPLSLWVMEVPARIFGFGSWSLLAPQAVEGVATVGLVYATVKRWSGAGAGLFAGAAMALTPVAVAMFRYDNPDALLVLLLVAATYATTRAVDTGRTRWLVLAGTLVGLGFMTKTLQALLVVPALGLAYLWAGPPQWRRRILQLLAGAVAMVVAGGWWVVAVMAVPASSRPYIGGSQDNSEWNLIFGYNGFGRLTGNETGSVGGGPATAGTTGQWGPTGLGRMFNTSFGGQASWLLPAALALLVVGLAVTLRRSRTDRDRAGLLLWGASMVVTALTFSLGKGIIHPYYTVALAPGISATTAIGASILWRHRSHLLARIALAVAVAGTGVWAHVLLGRTPTFAPWLRTTELVVAAIVAVALVVVPLVGALAAGRRFVLPLVATVAAVVGLSGSAAYALDTSAHSEGGALVSAGPATQGGPGGFGGFAGFGRRGSGGRARGAFPGFGGGGFPAPAGGFAAPAGGGFPAPGGGFAAPAGGLPGSATGGAAPSLPSGGAGTGSSQRTLPGSFFGGSRGGVGGLLNGSTPSAALTKTLTAGASRFTWVAAAVGAEQAAGYQLATGDSVMPIGGFNGSDPSPTLAAFERLVAAHRIHYFVAGGGFGGRAGTSSTSTQITTWVEGHFHSVTVGGTTLYDLTDPVSTNLPA